MSCPGVPLRSAPVRAVAAGGRSSRVGHLVDEVGYVPQKVRYLPKLGGAGRA